MHQCMERREVMYRKTAMLCICMLLTAVFGGCSNHTTDSVESTAQPDATAATETVSRNLYYAKGNGTVDPAKLGSFRAQLEADGYSWNEVSLTEIPSDADAVILNSPKQDITSAELEHLDDYMDQGGHLLLLLPANEAETRYKYLGRFLEPYCMVIDYDRICETDRTRIVNDDPFHFRADFISRPDKMPVYSAIEDTGTASLHNARSFYYIVHDLVSRVKQDVMLKTSASVVGEPYGGDEDDPIIYEETALNVMGYARDESRANSSVVFVGAGDFLLDENYADENSAYMVSMIHSSLGWFVQY